MDSALTRAAGLASAQGSATYISSTPSTPSAAPYVVVAASVDRYRHLQYRHDHLDDPEDLQSGDGSHGSARDIDALQLLPLRSALLGPIHPLASDEDHPFTLRSGWCIGNYQRGYDDHCDGD